VIKKDCSFTIDGLTYLVKNVPFANTDSEKNTPATRDIALKMALVYDLMISNELPNVIDFDKLSHLKL
jgi:hypothetical protein